MEVQKLTLKNVKKLKEQSDNALTKIVCDYIINEWDESIDDDENKNTLTDILKNGCANGSVHWLVYSSDILQFYEDYKHEINELIYKYGYTDLSDLFGDKWDKRDPLVLEDANKFLLAWFGFEETITNIARKFGIE